MATFFSHLECSVPCGAGPCDPRQEHHRCACGAPLLARYDLTAAKRWPRSGLSGREASMWRYRELLPLLQSARGMDLPVTLGEGWTPLLRARRLGATLGLKRIYVKDEGQNPARSWESRGMSAAITRALHLGTKSVTLSARGHASIAGAAYAARAAIATTIVAPADIDAALRDEAGLYGATVREAGADDVASAGASPAAGADGAYDLSALAEPYRIEGKKTIGYELAEQLGWTLPDWIVCPVGTGLGFIGIAKAFVEMAALGWIDPVRRPHMIAVQAAGCAPIVRAMGSNATEVEPWTSVRTAADDLRVPQPPGAGLVLRMIRESGGSALGVGDVEMTRDVKVLAELEGITAGLAGGAALHAVRVLAGEGRIKPHDTVVVINPGTGR